jgi:hypothetical protein
MARTTLIIGDQRMLELKRLAVARSQTLSSLVDELLRQGIERARQPHRQSRPSRLPVFDMGKPRVHIADRDQLHDFLEGR